ncbi:MAG: lysoplasmalogenase [Candidatus Marinimicrobia bacterium]|nr:lysoplasmalogenase [Candidatus Neomarinimicrobiota bacterium]
MRKSLLVLTISALLSAFLVIWGEYFGPQFQVYIFKPLTMVFIIAIALLIREPKTYFYKYAIIGGLIFSLCGDIFLMLPSDQFIAGLISFMIAHIMYIIAFMQDRPRQYKLVLLIPFVICGLIIFSLLSAHLENLKIPVLIYIVVILIMVWQATDRWRFYRDQATLIAFVGAMLFMLSDTIYALNRFREAFELGRLLTLSTYFTAQWFIACSIHR